MDLHEFTGDKMYFDEPTSSEVEVLIERASKEYASGSSEYPLLRAFFLAPENLSVLVALYRFYYFQHQYEDALKVADIALEISSKRLGIRNDWSSITLHDLGFSMMKSMTLVRFYLMCVKGAGYLNLRLGNRELGVQMLEKVAELDSQDRLGSRELLKTVSGYYQQQSVDSRRAALKVVNG